MMDMIHSKASKRLMFYPARRGRLGDSLRVALLSLLVAGVCAYAATQAGAPPAPLHGVTSEATAP